MKKIINSVLSFDFAAFYDQCISWINHFLPLLKILSLKILIIAYYTLIIVIILIFIYHHNSLTISLFMLDIFSEESDWLNNYFNKHIIELLTKQKVEPWLVVDNIEEVEEKKAIITLFNPKLLNKLKLYKAIYITLVHNGFIFKFSGSPVIISIGTELDTGRVFSLHDNFYMDRKTMLTQFIKHIIPNYLHLIAADYLKKGIHKVEVMVWDMDDYRNKKIKIPYYLKGKLGIVDTDNVTKNNKKFFGKNSNNKSQINITKRHFSTNKLSLYMQNDFTPLKPIDKAILFENRVPIIAIDIETQCFNPETILNKLGIKRTKKLQTPVLVTCAYINPFNDRIKSFYTLIDKTLIDDLDNAVLDLWTRFFKQLSKEIKWKGLAFMHNLGSFDGYFIYKALLLLNQLDPNSVEGVIDKDHNFIQISLKSGKLSLVWKDSMRIFDVSLKELCETFGSESKLHDYVPEFNNPSILNQPNNLDKFIKYGVQDSISLLKALNWAQEHYIDKYQVDITSIWSTSTLALKIFRTHFLDETIPGLNNHMDAFVRNAYYGGATDHYCLRGEKLYAYDVNSLYPNAMLKPMPFIPIKYHLNMKNIKLNDFFGFIFVKVTCPKNIEIPLLPYKGKSGDVIFPTGTWYGTYFSEELKALIPFGYKFKLIRGLEFSQKIIFDKYVNFFYELKKHASTDAIRYIAKMLLNQLYGYFGRSRELIFTINVFNSDLPLILLTRLVKTVVKATDTVSLVLISANVNYNIIKNMNLNIDFTEIKNLVKSVKSNVAISAAVTAYARIEMIKYKTIRGLKVLYTDTDSIYVDKPLPDSMVGDDLGLMKNELIKLDTKIIEKAIFLGNKKYIFQYYDSKGNLKTKTVFSGVKKNSLTWNDFEKMVKNESVYVNMPDVFTHSFKDLNISLNERHLNISKSDSKKLINNKYIPTNLFNGFPDFKNIVNSIVAKLLDKFKFLIKKYKVSKDLLKDINNNNNNNCDNNND